MPSTSDLPRSCLWLAFGILLNLSTAAADSLDTVAYDARLCTAGVVVLAADIAKLRGRDSADSELDWLQQRIDGLAGILGWLCKRYALARGLDTDANRAEINRLQEIIQNGQWNEASDILRRLSAQMPPDFGAMLPASASAEARQEAAAIYRRYCQACHLRSGPQQTPPVYSLRSMARQQPASEFIARMIIGIHGTPDIGLRNPLSPEDIAGIYAFLLGSGNQEAESNSR